jgi:hypothetical protein
VWCVGCVREREVCGRCVGGEWEECGRCVDGMWVSDGRCEMRYGRSEHGGRGQEHRA